MSSITAMCWRTAASSSMAMPRACATIPTSRNSTSANRAGARGAAIAPSSNTVATGDGMAELEIGELCLSFGGLTVLDRVSMAIAPAELLALIGPNGAGKTSVLNCISGIYRGQGHIRFRGSDIAGLSSRAIARLGIARTFQHSELFRHMSVLDNIMVGRHTRIGTNPLAEALFLV